MASVIYVYISIAAVVLDIGKRFSRLSVPDVYWLDKSCFMESICIFV